MPHYSSDAPHSRSDVRHSRGPRGNGATTGNLARRGRALARCPTPDVAGRQSPGDPRGPHVDRTRRVPNRLPEPRRGSTSDGGRPARAACIARGSAGAPRPGASAICHGELGRTRRVPNRLRETAIGRRPATAKDRHALAELHGVLVEPHGLGVAGASAEVAVQSVRASAEVAVQSVKGVIWEGQMCSKK